MDPKNDHAQIVINPFLIYIALALCALLLERYLPIPFIQHAGARIAGVIVLALNIPIGFPALRGMLSAKTSPNPHRPTTSLVLSGS